MILILLLDWGLRDSNEVSNDGGTGTALYLQVLQVQ